MPPHPEPASAPDPVPDLLGSAAAALGHGVGAAVVAATVQRWGRLDLPLAPAFRAPPEARVAE